MLPYPYPPVFRLRTCTIKNQKQPKFCIRMKAIEYGSNRYGSGRLQAVPVEIFFLIFGADKQKKKTATTKTRRLHYLILRILKEPGYRNGTRIRIQKAIANGSSTDPHPKRCSYSNHWIFFGTVFKFGFEILFNIQLNSEYSRGVFFKIFFTLFVYNVKTNENSVPC